MPSLSDPVRYLKGVGPEMARRLERLGIATVRDLLFHVPREYRDRRTLTSIGGLAPAGEASVLATLWSVRLTPRLRGRRDLTAVVRDETGTLRIVWFNQPYLADSLRPGTRYVFSGPVQSFRGLEMHNPDFEPEGAGEPHLHVGRLAPRYALTEGVAERWMRARVRDALDRLPPLEDPVSEEDRARLGLPALREALSRVHFPDSPEEADAGRRRIALEELLSLQVSLQYARARHRARHGAPSLAAGGPAAERFRSGLPFVLTPGQRSAIEAIDADLGREVPMRRLLWGEVGSGKTVVALHAAARAAGAGFQAAILAPTTILAEQHAATAERFLAPSGVRWALLTAATPAARRREILERVASGTLSVVIGTHALLQGSVAFPSLALVVVDEQHRFGVRQRIALAGRDRGSLSPHLLVLTATPIPRSLALALYGDLDLSFLPEKPPGRAEVRTEIREGDESALVALLAEEAAAGGSAFVVYPLVEDREALELKAAATMFERLARDPRLKPHGVALAHGRLKPEARRAALSRFRAGAARILVATTVVEVGVDVPEATLVVIEHPERFGLAQLHQIRGRVGRAERPGRCVLLTGRGIGELARRRLRILAHVTDGFRLAEEDLRLRGPGELLGTVQHGFPDLHAVEPLRDADLIEAS
ncbi:MAG TPA: ATP-dependent DNA helicase RecG, partial [Candidatus Eisenbacteria bacterium]